MRLRTEDLADMATFAAVARAGSYTGGAAALGTSKSAASKAVARLERRLGTRLFHRTTRSVQLTEAGRALEVRAARMVEEAGAGAAAVEALASAPLGTLRVKGPVTFGEMHLAPAVAALVRRHPGLRIELALDDRLVDAVAGGWDVVVRIAPLVDSAEARVDTDNRKLGRFHRGEAIWAGMRPVVEPLQRASLRRMLRAFARKVSLREELRSELMIDNCEVRDVLQELGRRLAGAGRIDAADDVFHLELSELERAFADPSWDARAAVRRELARRAAWRRIEVPNRFSTEEIDGMPAT